MKNPKVLLISNLLDNTGWSCAGNGYLLALDSVGIDVVARNIKLNNINGEVPQRTVELLQKSSDNCNVVIQHLLPYYLDYNGNFDQNIAIFASETSHFKKSEWAFKLNTMDKVWVINNQMREAAIKSGVKPRIDVIPHACDVTKFERSYKKLDIPELNGKFVFYFVGEFQPRKNLIALIKAFHLEFRRYEPVGLLLKVNPENCAQQVADLCDSIKKSLKLYSVQNRYHSEIIVSKFLNEEEMMSLHSTGNCLVNPAYGEAFGLSLIPAMGLGKAVIATDFGGPSDILRTKDGEAGWLVPGHMTNVYGMTNQFANLYCGDESWCEIDIQKLRLAMREVYENKEERLRRSNLAIDRVYDYSYSKVGEMMARAIAL